MSLAALLRRDPRGERDQLLDTVHTEVAEPFHQPVQHVDGGIGVGQGTVVRCGGGLEQRRERGELAVGRLVASDELACQPGRVHHLARRPLETELRARVS